MIGIDFGTTNTSAAVPGDLFAGFGATRALNVYNGNDAPYDTVLASTVLDPESTPFGEQRQLGLGAQRAYLGLAPSRRRAHRYLHAFKPRLDDQRLRERRRVIAGGHYQYDWVNQNDRFIPNYEWVHVGGPYTRPELVVALARILDFVLGQAQNEGAEDDVIMLGTPVSFSSQTRKRMLAALHATGRYPSYQELLRRVRFVHEPIAAAAEAMAEVSDFAGSERVLVFDHGGGTLDLSLVEFGERPNFDHPVPVRELGAGGVDDVAGRTIDHALIEELRNDPDVAALFDASEEWDAADAVESAKIELSTRDHVRVPLAGSLLEVHRDQLERAMRTTLARITVELDHVCRRAGLQPSDIDRVLMTGGSSLIPIVQQTVAEIFVQLDDDHLRRYDPRDDDQVERAITEVAQGLVRHAELDAMRSIVHWDLELATSESPGFTRVFEMGEEFDRVGERQLALTRRVPIKHANGAGMCFGLYEHQLDRTFVFGLADVPPIANPATLAITLLPASPFPVLRLLDHLGAVIAEADLNALPEQELKSFFACDVEYLPDTPFERFRRAPLSRKLKVDDYVEWSATDQGRIVRGRGTLQRIVRDDDNQEAVTEMDSWDLSEFRFFIADQDRRKQMIGHYGSIRLAPRVPVP